MRDGSPAPNGFIALYDLDGGEGVSDLRIDASDAVYSQLRLWIDDNHNGYSESNEFLTLAQAGITTLFTTYRETQERDRYGNWFRYAGSAVRMDGQRGEVLRPMFDVFLKMASY